MSEDVTFPEMWDWFLANTNASSVPFSFAGGVRPGLEYLAETTPFSVAEIKEQIEFWRYQSRPTEEELDHIKTELWGEGY